MINWTEYSKKHPIKDAYDLPTPSSVFECEDFMDEIRQCEALLIYSDDNDLAEHQEDAVELLRLLSPTDLNQPQITDSVSKWLKFWLFKDHILQAEKTFRDRFELNSEQEKQFRRDFREICSDYSHALEVWLAENPVDP